MSTIFGIRNDKSNSDTGIVRQRFQPIRLDRSGDIRRTEMGFIEVDVVVATAGVLEYSLSELGPRYQGQGLKDPIKELVTADLLEESTPDLDGVTLTKGHPPSGEVNPQNFQQTAVGHISNPEFEPATDENRARQVATAVIRDSDAINAYQSEDMRQFSLGYFVQFNIDPGTHDDFGEYDTEQLDRLIHHVALVSSGRAEGTGPYGMRLDSNLKQKFTTEEINMLGNRKDNEDGEDRQDQEQAMLEKLDIIAEGMESLMEAQKKQTEMMSDMIGTEDEENQTDESDEENKMDEGNRTDWYRDRKDIESKAEAVGVELSDDFANIDGMKKVLSEAKPDRANRLDSDSEIRAAFTMLDVDTETEADGKKMGEALRGDSASEDDGEFLKNPSQIMKDNLSKYKTSEVQ